MFNRYRLLTAILFLTLGCSFKASLLAQGTFGTTLIDRSYNDGAGSQVYIYAEAGGLSGTAQSFSFYNNEVFDGRVTPLIFERVSYGHYILRGVGATITPTSIGSQAYAFNLVAGTNVMQPNYTFGFTDREVSYSGSGNAITTTASRTGTVDWDYGGTTQWLFTPSLTFEISLGQTFQVGDLLFSGETRSYSAQFTVAAVNQAPTNITLTPGSLAENSASGSSVGTLTATDANVGQSHTFSLVAGGADNASFSISGSFLLLNLVSNFEVKSSYSVRVRADDGNGGTFDKDFVVSITNVNEAPTEVSLSAISIAENNAANATVGTLSSTDPDASNSHSYSLVSGAGSTDNAAFNTSGTSLRLTASADFETKSSYSLRLRSTDQGGLFFEKQFTITITNVNDAPVAVADAFATPTNIARTINTADLTSNDTDQDAHLITLTSVQSPTNGASVSLNAGVITYTPAAAFTGTATFTYSISDGAGGTATGTVTMTVNGSVPVVLNDTTMTITVPTTITNPVTLSGDGGITTSQPVTFEGPVTVTGTPVITTTTTVTISGPIDGTGELEKTGSGTLNITSPSTFTGGFKATDGVVGLGHDAALGTGPVTLGGASINAIGETRVLDNPVNISGNTVITGAGIGLSGPVTLSGPRGLQTDGTLDIDGPIHSTTGNTQITKLGEGDLVLAGNNTFAGGVDVKQGTLALAGDQAAGTGTVTLSGGTLEAIGDRELSNPIKLQADTVVTGDAVKMNGPVEVSGIKTLTTEADVELGGNITTTAAAPEIETKLIKEGAGALILSPLAKNSLDIDIVDGTFENKGVSYGSVNVISSAPVTIRNEGQYASQAIVGGVPAVSYYDSTNGDLKYMRASTADGSSFQAAVTVDSVGKVGVDTSLFVVNGNPAIAYWQADGNRLKYVRANDAWGTTWGTPVVLSVTKGKFTSLQVVAGNPAVAFYATASGDLMYIRAQDANGLSWGTASTVSSSGNVGSYPSMAIVDGRPAIACRDTTKGLMYFRALNATGSLWGPSKRIHEEMRASSIGVGKYASMTVVNGRPAIGYVAYVRTSQSKKAVPALLYIRSSDATGASWPNSSILVDDPVHNEPNLSLSVVGGVPAVSYLQSKTALNYAWADDANGTSWPSSRKNTVQKIASPHSYTSLQMLSGGKAGIAFYDGKTDDIEFKSFNPKLASPLDTARSRIASRNDRKLGPKARRAAKKAGKSAVKKPTIKGKNSKTKKIRNKGKGRNAVPTKAGKTKTASKLGGIASGNQTGKKTIGKKGGVRAKNGRSPGMTEEAEDLIWEDGVTIVWDVNDANGLPGLNWDYYKVVEDLEIVATADDPIYLEIESLLPDNLPGNVTNFSPYVAKSWKIASAGTITGFDPAKFVVSSEGFTNDLQGGSFSVAQSGNGLNLVFTPVATQAPEITVLLNGVGVSTGASVNAGTLAAAAQTTLSFTIRNDGSGPLGNLSIGNGSPLTGEAVLAFEVPDVSVLAPGASLTFDANLSNAGLTADGLAAAFSITSDDADEGTFSIVVSANSAVIPMPEIAVAKTIGNVALTSGSLTPVDFGNVSTADAVTLDFTLANQGAASLTDIDFIIDGPNSIDFHLIEDNITDLDGLTTTSFKVEFEPSAVGVRAAVLYIRSNDADESPFLINLTGTGDAVPEITVETSGQELVAGALTPVNFGSQAVNAHKDTVFNISNIGTLDLTGLAVSITGGGATHYSIQTGLAATTLAPASGAPVVIRYSPTAAGAHNAVLRVMSNDADESVFEIALTGTANIAPEFELRDDTPAVFADGGFFDFGTALTYSTTSRSFTIRNMGSASLTGLSMSVSGAAAGDFILGGLSTPAPLDGPAGETTFSITFYPTEYGSRNAVLHIVSNDSDEGDFTLYLTGTGELPPAAPTDIVLAPSALPENTGPGSLVGSLSALGVAPEETPTFSFVSGAGDTDNSLFNLDGADLTLIGNPDYETQASYSLRVQADNGVGGSFTKVLTVTVTDVNEAPTDITLSLSSIAENNAPNATVGTLTATGDPDAGATNSFTLVAGDGDTDNGSFTIDGSVLKITPSADFETKNSYALRVQASEGLGGTFAKALTVTITNVSDAPSGTDKTINVLVNGSYTFAVSDWGFSDSDSPANAFTAVKIATLPGSGTLRLNGSNITANQTVTFNNTPAGTTWTAAAGLSSLDGLSSALSNDGSRAIVGIWAGPVYVSSNGGSSWSQVLSDITATRFAVSSDGLKIIAVTRQNNIYTSTDGGATWTSRAFSAFWASVACSADGVYAIAGTDGGNLYRSTDSGVTWTAINSLGSAYWGGAGCSADGSKMVATSTHGIHTSTDYGATWTQRFTTSGGIFTGAASSADGTRLYATYSGGFIQVSTDSGATWTARATSQDWGSVSCTTDGLTAITSFGANSMVSNNGGTTWTQRHTATSIRGTSVSGNGTKMLAPVGGGVRSVPLFVSNGNATVITYTPSSVGSTSFTFQVQDDGADTNLDLTPNTISINATNEAPTNITLSASSMAENNAANATVGNLTATDADPGQTHSFSLVSGSGDTDNGSFTINGSALRLTPSADFETKSSYALRVQASDGFGGTFAKDFTVTITDVNEAATDITLSNTLMVENDSNLNVGTLVAVDQDASQTHTFTLVGGTGSTDNSLFNISGTTLRLNSPANYEYKPTLSVRVRATDNGTGALFYEEPFTISVTDLQEPPYDITFSGSAPGGTLYANGLTARVVYATGNITGLAYSDNMLINGVNVASQLTTQISYVDFADYNTAGRFAGVLPFPGRASLTDVNNLVLNVTGTIIVPTTGTYTFAVRSDDGARIKIDGVTVFADDTFHGELESFTAVNLTAGAHALDFLFFEGSGGGQVELFAASGSHASYNGAFSLLRSYPLGINENTASGSQVAALGASDDSGNTHTFELVSGSGATDNASFSLSTSGLLTTNFIPDFETKSSYSIRVRATDNTSQTYEQVLTVSIFDINETPSTIALSNATVTEHNLVGSTVGTFSTTDQDATQTFTYSLVAGVGSTNNNLFAISGNSLLTQISTDYETLIPPTYSVRVRSTDQGGLFTEQDYVITILDANDPATDIALSNAQIDENNAAGVTLGTLTTTDPNPGQTHTYSLVSGTGSTDNARFSITGDELKLLVSANYEVQPTYSVRIRTTDNGAPANLWYEEAITITINGVNEAPGVTSALVYEITNPIRVLNNIAYNIDNSLIYGATAFNRVRYRMEMFVGGVLRYADTSFEPWSGLTVAGLRVPDGAYPLTHKRTVSNMTVESNYPGVVNVTGATGALEHWPSSYNQGLNGLYDYDDAGFNSSLGYGSFQVHNMSSTPKQTVFAWNNHGSSNPDIGFGNQSSGHPDWTFAGSASGRDGWKMQVYIGAGINSYSISENNAADVSVGNVYAYDEDAGDGLTYQLVSGTGDIDNALFYLDGIALKTSISFDFETKSTYSVRLRATDLGGLSSEYVATISILNANETPTDIALSSASIAENNAANATVGTFTTTDVDTLDSFNYTLVAGAGSTDNGSFNISANALRLNAATSYESKSIYNVRIRSTDAGGLWVEKPFVVTITDANDAPHDITLTPASIAENEPVDSVVGALAALDQDPTHTHTFSLVSGTGSADNASFEVYGSNLKIKVSANFEAKNTYAIRVRTTDDGSPPAFYEEAFTVSITNVNEAPTLAAVSVNGFEDSTLAFTSVNFTGSFTDPENDAFSSITVATLPATGALKLAGTDVTASQVISAANLPNLTYVPALHENGPKTFTVTATDGTFTTSAVTVTMNLTAVNDAPSFAVASEPAGVTWTARESRRNWISITSSADGSKLAALDQFGQIYTSTDSGANWTARDSNRTWQAITSSADGSKLAAVEYSGKIYTSIDSGLSWTARDSNRAWLGIVSSADGSKLAAVAEVDKVYTSTDSGLTWTPQGPNRNWRAIASSADGSKLAAVENGGKIYTSTDSGVNWIARDANRIWYSITSSSDGSKLAAVEQGGQIYTSTDSGQTWTARDSNRDWFSITSSADGSKLAAVVFDGQIYTSTDSGLNWTARESNLRWASITSSADGNKLAAVVKFASPGQIFTSVSSSFIVTVAEDAGAQTVPNVATSISPGPADESAQTLTFTVTNTNNALFSAQPAVAANGTLTFTPAINAFGSATVSVTAADTGGTANGGVDTSAAQTFTLTVTPVNDTPVITSNGGGATGTASVAENTTAVTTMVATDVETPSSQTLTYSKTGLDADLFTLNTSTGLLTFTVAPNFEIPGDVGGDNVYDITLNATDSASPTASDSQYFSVTVTNVNETPTDLALTLSSITENNAVNAALGTLSTTDVDAGNTFTYSLVSGTGSTDNASFNISGSNLRIGVSANFEAKNSYAIRLRTTDQGGLFYEEALTVTINDVNEAPYEITVAGGDIPENNASDAAAATFAALDVDGGSSHAFELVSGAGSADNASFSLAANGALSLNISTDYETQNSFSIRVRATDNGSLYYEKAFTISITDVNEVPSALALTGSTVNENVALNTAVGSFSTTDEDAANTFIYSLVTGTGGTNNANFNISGNSLRANAGIDFEAGATRSIRVRSTDQGGLFFESAFTITIRDVNEMPSFGLTTNDRVPFSTAIAQSRPGFLININDGDSEATQTLTFNVSNNNNGMFSLQPAISSTGALTYTPNGTGGVATVSVSLTDDNSINSNAALTSAIQTFTITVDPSPDYDVVTTSTTVTITNLSNSSDALSFTDGGTFATFVASGRTFSLNGALNQAGGINLPYASLPGIELITINAEGGSDTINIGDFSALVGFPSLTINGGTGDDTINLKGDITFAAGESLNVDLQDDVPVPGIDRVSLSSNVNLIASGAGGITFRCSRSFAASSATSLETVDGNIVVEVNQQAVPTQEDVLYALVSPGLVSCSGTGQITLKGRGGNSPSGSTGVRIFSTVQAGAAGTLVIEGMGGSSAANGNYGVLLNFSSCNVTTAGADIQITGTGGGSGSSGSNYGVYSLQGGNVSAGGAGAVTILGSGGTSTGSSNHGFLSLTGGTISTISSSGGNISITGNGGASSGSTGVQLQNGNDVVATGSGNITINGTGGGGASGCLGVSIESAGTTVSAVNGDIHITGVDGPGTGDVAFRVLSGATISTSGTGNISVSADTQTIATGLGQVINAGSNSVNLKQVTGGQTITLGTGGSQLQFTDGQLDAVAAGTLNIGDGSNGSITVSTAISPANVTTLHLISGGSIGDTNSVGADITVANLTTSGILAPGGSPGQFSVVGNHSLAAGSTFSVEIGGLTPGTQHDQLSATGSVNISAGTTLAYSKIGTYNPVIGQVLNIISRTGGTGTFAGAPEGTLLTLDFLGSGLPAVISYVGGDGDDVVIRVANPNIQVEQPVDTILADAVSTVDFGTRTIAMTSAQTFRVRNTGTSDLTLSSLDISGTHAADFAVTTAPSSMVISPDATTTFVVTFTPSSNLTRTAWLSISSNDPDEAVFTINLQGYGNFAPTDIIISSATVLENSAVGTSIGLLGAVDADVGQAHSFSLVSGAGSTDNSFFQIDGATLRILITTDFETKSFYSIRVRAGDAFSASYEKQLIITVLDMNDFPEITINNGAATAAYTVEEQTTFVTTVTAFDIDTPFQHLTYSVSGADAALFEIENQTGQLSFKAALDYEAPQDANLDNVYQVNVIVTDDGSPNLSTSQALSVYVRDMNDLPVIVSHSGAASVPLAIPENTTAVTTVEAEDEDLPAQALTYSIIGGADASRFAIDSDTGVLIFINAPDADEPLDQLGDNTYYVTVCVTDDGPENLTDKQEFIVSISNVNEAPTEITLSATSLDERNAVNAIVGSFSAEDQDLGQTHSFSLVTGSGSDDNSFFTITGASLSINVSTTYATKSSYSILVRAIDSGSPELSFEKAFTITILSAGSAPLVVTDPATLIAVTSATLNAKVTPNEIASTAWFVYGTDPTLTTDTVTTTAQSVGAGTVPVSTSAAITGLLPETVYYYRVLAENLKGTSEGIIRSFQTSYAIASNMIIPGASSGDITLLRPLSGPINQAGQISFSATAKTGVNGITTAKDSILISDVSGGLRVIAQEGTAVPGGGTLFGSYTHQILTDAGQTVTLDRMLSSVTAKDYAYFVSPDGLSLELLSREGDAVTGGGTFMTHTGKPAADASERLYFQGTVMGVVATKNTGVWYDEAGDLLNLAKEGSNVTAITGDPAWLGNFQAMISAEGDGAAFIAALQNNPDSTTQKTTTATNLGLFSGSPGSVGLIARKGQLIPSVGKLSAFSGLSRSNAGDHAFISLLTVSTTAPVVATTNDQVLMAEISGNLHVVARENITPLVSALKAARFGNFQITSEGEVIFQAWLAGAGVTTANDGVLCRWTVADGIELLAREGSLATGTGLNYRIFQVLSVSPGGAIALQSTLSTGIALMRALPGASLDKVVKNAENVSLNGTSRSILTLSIHQTGAGTGGGGGGMGAGINDEGEVFTVLSVSGALYVGRVYP